MAGTEIGCGVAVYGGTTVYNRCKGFELVTGFSREPEQDHKAGQVLILGCIEQGARIRLCRVTGNHEILRIF
jgi:hypothetical protein